MEKDQTVLVFTELTISEEASLSGGEYISAQGGYAGGGFIGIGNGSSVSAVGTPGVVIISDPFAQVKDLVKGVEKIPDKLG